MIYVPNVIEIDGNIERYSDIFSRLLKERIILLTGEVNDQSAAIIKAMLLFLESENSNQDITLYIDSPGGVITSGMGIYDTMNYIKPDVVTICTGQACSMGSFLLSSGTKGKRFSLPNSTIMIHQPLGGAEGQATDIQIRANHIQKTKENLSKILSKNTGQEYEKVLLDTDRDNFMTAEEALEYGLIDAVITNRNEASV